MFIGRTREIEELKRQFSRKQKTAVLLYGKRRVGKTALLREAAEQFDGTVIHFLCVRSSYEGNLGLLSQSVSEALGLPEIQFRTIFDLFHFLGKQQARILFILDEYQYLKEALKTGEMDSYMQSVVDSLPANVKLVLCGSYISIMKELLLEDNPLFGRFTYILHLEEFAYQTAAEFYPTLSSREKIAYYAVFGGSPYVLENLDADAGFRENICHLLISETSLLRTYIENVALKEIQKVFDVRILQLLGNGKKRYSEISEGLGGHDTGILDKQLKSLLQTETIRKIYPINKQNDRKKQFYEIRDNLMRFYFTYIFGNQSRIETLGAEGFYETFIAPSVTQYISRRFEEIARQYFSEQVKNGTRKDITNIGTYWYDDAAQKKNGEFDCVLQRGDVYDVYECKYYEKPMTKADCHAEEKQIRALSGLNVDAVGFVCSAGFSFSDDAYELIAGDALFEQIAAD